LARKIPSPLPLFLSFGYFSLLILTAFLDWEERAIYDPIIFLGIIFGFLFNMRNPFFSVSGLVVGFLAFLLLRGLGFLWKGKEMLGMGDIFLGGMIGSLLGWKRAILALFLSAFLGLTVSLLLIGFKVWRKEDYIPFGSFLSLGTGLVFLFGDGIISSYLYLLRLIWGLP
jgi:leader peptidase (prepilin peptidase)/N-methyltransferase